MLNTAFAMAILNLLPHTVVGFETKWGVGAHNPRTGQEVYLCTARSFAFVYVIHHGNSIGLIRVCVFRTTSIPNILIADFFFYVSLTVHLSITLANDQLDARIFLIHLLQSSTCTCFEQYFAHPRKVKLY